LLEKESRFTILELNYNNITLNIQLYRCLLLLLFITNITLLISIYTSYQLSFAMVFLCSDIAKAYSAHKAII